MKTLLILASLAATSGHALVVVRPEFRDEINLRIVRAEPESFETYTLLNQNGREMTLVCANNRVYDNNPKPIIRYRNFYGEEAGDFILESEKECRELGRFIESASAGVDHTRPFLITLSKKGLRVKKIVYPAVDPYADNGDLEDLLPKKRVYVTPAEPKKVKKPLLH